MSEIECWRDTPEIGKCYETVESTRRTGPWDNRKYYSTNKPRYVGEYVGERRYGMGDGSQIYWDFKNDNGEDEEVHLSYEGTTCVIEVECPSKLTQSEQRLALAKVSDLIPDYDTVMKISEEIDKKQYNRYVSRRMREEEEREREYLDWLQSFSQYGGGKRKKTKKKRKKKSTKKQLSRKLCRCIKAIKFNKKKNKTLKKGAEYPICLSSIYIKRGLKVPKNAIKKCYKKK